MKKKNNKKDISFNKFILTALFMMLIMFMLNATTIFFVNKSTDAGSITIDEYYKIKAKQNMNQNITKIIGDYCLLYKTNMSRVKCVHSFVRDSGNFNYTTTNDIILSDELIEQGGDCKSWTTFYKGMFNYMKIDTQLIHSTNHVYLNAFDDNFYCSIDQQSIDCKLLGQQEE